MSGIYIHIPFCRKKCHYCNFHFSVSLKNKKALLNALLKEIEMNYRFLGSKRIDTLYFGGGTPSVLTAEELKVILDKLREYFQFGEGIELTLEANPDDLNPGYLGDLRKSGVNRLSVGIQSFFDRELQLMNRSHDADQAKKAFQLMKKAGFDDYSIDLIFGMPESTLESWRKNLDQALGYEAPHFSFYNLTVEPGTALDHMVKKGKIISLPDNAMAEQFLFSMDYMKDAGYDHYEISNYALPGRHARHNTAYWQGKPYLGLGPSAHSFKENIRRWNVANNPRYIKAIQEGNLPFEEEILSLTDQYNEYIMTGLRTMWGVDLLTIKAYGMDYQEQFNKGIHIEKAKGRVRQEGTRYFLTKEGKLFADEVASELFLENLPSS
jgi:oxygen-independent coproporphyrinogen-3 oxidase